MFDFAWPWVALLLPLPVLVWRLSRPAAAAEPRERRITLLHPALRDLDAAFATRRPGGLRRAGLRPWLLALAWIALVVALSAAGLLAVATFDSWRAGATAQSGFPATTITANWVTEQPIT